MSKDSETEELEKLYHRHKAEIWRYLNSLARDPDEAEDLMQSVFIKLIPRLKAGGLSGPETRAYLFRMAYNLYVDTFRRRGREGRALDRLAEGAPDKTKDEQSGREMYQVIHEVLESDRLSERQANLLKLRILGHYRLKEIAESTEVPISTVHRELQAGLNILRGALTRAGIKPEDYEG